MTRSFACIHFCFLFAVAGSASAQSFDSGSKGSDGALILATPGTIVWDARAFNPPLNPSGDNVYHFTYVYIAKGVTVKLSAKLLHSPVFWLSQGPVVIDGTIDLDGADGGRTPAIAGAGGYPGGIARNSGYGPGAFKSNMFLVPLVGGIGGHGGETQGGGAGGGALLVASSTSITINGAITARGGASADGTGGNGGAVRVIARTINGSGLLSAKGGQPGGGDGLVRFEDFDNQFTGNLNNTPFVEGKPFGLFLPPNPQGSVRVVSIGGVSVSTLSLTINQPSPLDVVVEARFIPPGTVVQLEFFPESGPSQTISTTPLEGSFELSQATASVTFPSGLARVQVKAAWRQPGRPQQPQ
jgi:hypothetical protein